MTQIEINVGLYVAYSRVTSLQQMQEFAHQLIDDVVGKLKQITDVTWNFDLEEPVQLSSDDAHYPSDFLDEASERTIEGPFDLVIVLTDISLISRRQRIVAGLASPLSHVAIISTRKFLNTPRGQPRRHLDDPSVRWNSATFLLHLLGHLLGLEHSRRAGTVMARFVFTEDCRAIAPMSERSQSQFAQRAKQFQARKHYRGSILGRFAFYLSSVARHPGKILRPLLHNRALLLPLALPSLVTAAVAPTFILVFTAEIWDVGLNITPVAVWVSVLVTILASAWYLTQVQNLFFPHDEERQLITEQIALVNAAIFLTILLATIGLFIMVTLLMLLVEIYIFPPGLIRTWPTLEDPVVDFGDKIRLAIFISTIGTFTGALAGGLENRAVIRHLALFLNEP